MYTNREGGGVKKKKLRSRFPGRHMHGRRGSTESLTTQRGRTRLAMNHVLDGAGVFSRLCSKCIRVKIIAGVKKELQNFGPHLD